WAEEPSAVGLQQAVAHQLVDRAARRERGVKRDPRVRPADLLLTLIGQVGGDPLVAHLHERVRERRVVLDQPRLNIEDPHAPAYPRQPAGPGSTIPNPAPYGDRRRRPRQPHQPGSAKVQSWVWKVE